MKTIDDALKYADTFDKPANKHMSIVMLASEVRRLRDEINGLTGSLDRAEKALKEAQEQKPVAWMHDKDGRVDTCHDSVKKLWLKVGQQQNTQFMREIVPCRVEHYNIPLYASPVPAAPAVAFNISDNVDANTSSAERIDDNSSAPAVAAPAVQDDCVSQDESTMMMAASALVLYRAGESAEYMAKAIEAMLQSAPHPTNGDAK